MPCRAADKAHRYAKVIDDVNGGCGPEDAIWHIDRKHLKNGIGGDHSALKQLLRSKRGLRSLFAAKTHWHVHMPSWLNFRFQPLGLFDLLTNGRKLILQALALFFFGRFLNFGC